MADDDHPSNPGTAPFVPDFDDTGSQPSLLVTDSEKSRKRGAEPSSELKETPETSAPDGSGEDESAAGSVQSVTVPGRYQYLKWWKLALVILGMWSAAAEVGLSLFYWWYHSIDKTPSMFVVLVYVVACVVSGVMLAMVQGRPLISALSLAVMSGPFASVAAAAPLYAHYYCARVSHCVVSVIPY